MKHKNKIFAFVMCVAVFIASVAVPCKGAVDAENSDSLNALLGELKHTAEGAEGSVSLCYDTPGQMAEDMQSVAQNEYFEFLFNTEALTFALKSKKTGAIFTSNPHDASNSSNFSGNVANDLTSQVVLSYVDEDNQLFNMWSSADCAENGQYTVDIYENGVAVNMSLGKEEESELLPIAFTEERFGEIMSELSGRAAARMELFYTLFSLEDCLSEAEKKDSLKKYPALETQSLYICDPDSLNQREKDEISESLLSAGYNLEKYSLDAKELGITVEKNIYANFKFTVVYLLTETGLKATIVNDTVKYDDKHFRLLSFRLLQFFGADKPDESSEGYLFIPDGSGAVISFNNQDSNKMSLISGAVYGSDPTVLSDESTLQSWYLPVFGIVRNNNSALFSVIETGDALSEITASLGLPQSDYYTVYNTFSWTSEEYTETFNRVNIGNTNGYSYFFDGNHSKQDFTVSYYCLFDDKASYSGMAECYRKLLLAAGLSEKEGSAETRLDLNTLGTALGSTSFLGFEYDTQFEFTSYLSNIEMLEFFSGQGIENIHLSLSGWMKNGLDHGVANSIKYSKKLGGKSDYNELSEYCREHNIFLSTQNDILFSNQDRWFDGFSHKNHTAKTLKKQIAYIADYSPDTFEEKNLKYVISPKKYGDYLDGLFEDRSKNDISSVALNGFGKYLISDFNEKSSYNREQTKTEITDLLSKYSKKAPLEFDGANAYILPYASHISNLTMTNSGIIGETAAVPFVQLVLSGCASYSSEPVNLSSNPQKQLLDCIASGTSPAFLLSFGNTELLKKTAYSRYYSIDYKVLREKTAQQYSFVEEALNAAEGSRLIGHSIIRSGLVIAEYENSAKIAINYNSTDEKIGSITVKAESYALVN